MVVGNIFHDECLNAFILLNPNFGIIKPGENMSKPRDTKKEAKKKPAKSLKEKRAVKKAKKGK